MKLRFEVELEFSEPISPNSKGEVADKILNGLIFQASEFGFVPDDENAFTTRIRVRPITRHPCAEAVADISSAWAILPYSQANPFEG